MSKLAHFGRLLLPTEGKRIPASIQDGGSTVADHETCPDAPQPSTVLVDAPLPTLDQVCESPDAFLGKLDVGTLNLMCAAGLPGAEDLDIAKQIAWLDGAADQVDLQTRHRFSEFTLAPSDYSNSPGYFCCNYLLRTLQEGLGVQYNPARVTDSDFQNPACINPDFRDARDLFIHGMMGGPGGTCASMPVMYVAIGRRLGYPLKLVEAPGHLFFRWDDPEGRRFNAPERFNVEGAGRGISCFPDDFYRKWPREWKPLEKVAGCYLKSMSPAEELAGFLATRGACLEDNGRIAEAIQAFAWATKLVPDDVRYHTQVAKLFNQSYEASLQALEAERRALDFERTAFEQKARRPENIPSHLNSHNPHGPSHSATCQCAHCRQARHPIQPQMPGHPLGCGCFHCKQAKSSSFSPW
jgi:hypothetical protein